MFYSRFFLLFQKKEEGKKTKLRLLLSLCKSHPLCFLLPADYSTSEMLVNMGNLPLDEFYPAVAIVTLMRILRDPSLSNHHTMVVQAVTFIFKSLGLKCVQFLPQVMPTFLNVIRVCDASIREVGGAREYEEREAIWLIFVVRLLLVHSGSYSHHQRVPHSFFSPPPPFMCPFCTPVPLPADGNVGVLCEDPHPAVHG